MPSLFEEQIDVPDRPVAKWEEFQGVSSHHYRELMHYNHGPEAYLHYIEQAKRVVSMPLFASLNGTSSGGWLDWARRIEQAGADGLELNLMILSIDPLTTAAEIEDRYVEIVSIVRNAVKLPLAVKLGPHFTALPNIVSRLVAAGADGVVLFNRYLQPDINLSRGRVVSHLSLSTPQEVGLTLRWLGILSGRVPTSLAASGGFASGVDVLKAIAVGADVVQLASTLYHRGIDALLDIRREAEEWLRQHEFPSIEHLKGTMSQLNCSDPAAFARANYTRAISSFVTDAA